MFVGWIRRWYRPPAGTELYYGEVHVMPWMEAAWADTEALCWQTVRQVCKGSDKTSRLVLPAGIHPTGESCEN